MRRSLLSLAVVSLVAGALLLSRGIGDPVKDNPMAEGFRLKIEDKNPWTHLKPNASPEQFQFAIVSDRTGGHRAGIFSKAVQQINLMQPEFVMSVGDLIEGSRDPQASRAQWSEFNAYAKQFQMPFFYVAGNHDSANANLTDVWKEQLGRRNYSFVYKNCLFVTLNSNDDDGDDPKVDNSFKKQRIGKVQREELAKTLKENPQARWTFVFLHHPVWAGKDLDANGWNEVETILEGRPYTVFCGHVHTFRKYVRKGRNLYQLATTGGGSQLRGIDYGEFDQIAWVTMKNEGPVISQLALQGIQKEDLSPFESEEGGTKPESSKGLIRVGGSVTVKGQPGSGLAITFTMVPAMAGQKSPTGYARTTKTGTFELYGEKGTMGLKPGKYRVSFTQAPPLVIDPTVKNPVTVIAERFKSVESSPIEVEVKEGETKPFQFEIE